MPDEQWPTRRGPLSEDEVEAIALVVEAHLPTEDALYSPYLEAGLVAWAFLGDTGLFRSFDPDEQREALQRVVNAARELHQALWGMHDAVEMSFSLRLHAMGLPSAVDRGGTLPMVLLWEIPDMIEKAAKAEARNLPQNDPPGARTNWQAVSVVWACQQIWQRRRLTPAPVALNEASPFGRFVFDVFDACKLGASPRAAAAALARIQSCAEKND